MEYTISNRMSSLRGSAIREIFKYAADPSVISLAGGNPAPELFPHEALSDIAAEVLREVILSIHSWLSRYHLTVFSIPSSN